MHIDQFDQQIEVFCGRVAALFQRTEESPLPQQQLVAESLEELRTALEKLQIAQEELRQQNEELADARQVVEAERQRYQELFEFAPEGYLVTDASGTIREANRAAATMLNVSQQFLIGLPLVLFVAESERRAFHSQLTRLRQENRVQKWELCLQSHHGAKFDAALTVTTGDRSGSCVALRVCMRDITDRKRSEAALRESEERFRLMVEGVKDYAIFMLSPDGRVVSWNAGAERILGYQEAEIIGQHASRFFTPEDIQSGKPEQELRTAVAEGRVEEEHWHVRKGGTRFWGSGVVTALRDEAGNLRGFSKIMRDMTAAKQAKEEREQLLEQLEAERGLLDAVVRQMPAGVMLAEAPSGRIILSNTQADQIWCGPMPQSDSIAQYHEYNGVHPDGRPYKLEEWPLARSISMGEVVMDEEIDIVRGDGIGRTMCISSAPIRDRSGRIVAGVLTFYDITERKQLEAALRQQAEELAQANRMKDEFLATLSHELRTPLNAILNWSGLLRTRKFNEATTARALETIERKANLQFQLIKDLLDVSDIIQGKIRLDVRPVYLVSVIAAAINTMRLAAQAKAIRIESALDPTVGLVLGDGNRWQQIVWNLLSNAVKFTPEGGQVEIRLERVSSQAQITISDTGCGIGADFLPYVFDRFRQFDSSLTRSYGGLGLGLAIVRHLVELHGGTVHAESPGEGQGATFTVNLPLIDVQAQTSDRIANSFQELKHPGKQHSDGR